MQKSEKKGKGSEGEIQGQETGSGKGVDLKQDFDFADPQDLYLVISQSIRQELTKDSKSSLFQSIKFVSRRFDGLKDQLTEAMKQSPRSPAREDEEGELLTKEEQAQIISDVMRKNAASLTGADAKGLTVALRDLMPELYGHTKDDTKPDPCAVMAYLVSFGGANGKELVQDLGGKAFLESELSDLLGIQVKLGE